PRDVAYVRTGMPALVKLTAYDYAIYGGLEGTVTLVSPDTLHDQKRPSDLKLNQDEAFYRVLVTTQNSHLTDKNGKELPVIPGMIAGVDIKTGEKTVFQYLIKPITRMKQAMQER
ncbi:HlyD family secretion protein, partial [Escherichia coli]